MNGTIFQKSCSRLAHLYTEAFKCSHVDIMVVQNRWISQVRLHLQASRLVSVDM